MFSVKLDLTPWKKELKQVQKVDHTTANKRFAKKMLAKIKKEAPVDTGKYRASWKIAKVTKSKITIQTPMGWLFDILEFQGSKPHKIRPVRASILHWKDRTTGADRFAMEVNHPGFDPIPHVRPALKKVIAVWAEMVVDDWTEREWITRG